MGAKLFVGNLPFDTDEASLRRLFEETGKAVSEVAIITDRATGRPRGFAFVTMENDGDAREVTEKLNGAAFGGRNLVVNEAQPRPPREPRPVGRGFGSGGGGGGGGYGGGGGGGGGYGGERSGGFPPKAGGSRRKRRQKRIL